MLKCEGYKMFKGVMRITPKTDKVKPFEIESIWLYRPDTKCWYGDGRSFSESICEVILDASNA